MDEDAGLGLADLLLTELSPAEVPLLGVFGAALVTQGSAPPRSDGALGFGVEELSWLTVVAPIAGVVVNQIGDVVKGAASDVVKARAGSWLTAMRERRSGAPATPSAPPQLPPELAAQVMALAYDHARILGLDEPRARLLGAALHGSLLGGKG